MHIFWGLVTVVIGFLLVKYSFPLTNFFGHITWAENTLGGGGTNVLYKIVGIIIIILGFLYTFGNVGFITGPLAPLFGGK